MPYKDKEKTKAVMLARYIKLHPNSIRRQTKLSPEERQERERARRRACYLRHRDEVLAKNKRWRAKHYKQRRAKILLQMKIYYQTHREEILHKQRTNRAAWIGWLIANDYPIEGVNYHHRDPRTKKFEIRGNWIRHHPLTMENLLIFKEELAKCDALPIREHTLRHHLDTRYQKQPEMSATA